MPAGSQLSLVGYVVQVIACSFVEQPIVGIFLTLSAASFHPFTPNKNFYSYSQYLRGDVAHAKGCGTGVALNRNRSRNIYDRPKIR